ncbi:MAG: hypothetical protein HY812_06025 [Planctomycetes bacterium]|nr:hypothetical protein [Planctomycetota bacterium]
MPNVADQTPGDVLDWTMRVRLVGDRFFFWDMLRWAFLTGLAVTVLLAVVFVAVGRAETLPFLLAHVWIILAGVLGACFLIALIVFRNRYFVRYLLDEKGVCCALVHDTASLGSAAGKMAVALGVLTRSPAAAGAGLLAAAGQAHALRWQEIRKIRVYDGPRVISLRNSWRTVFRLHCADADSYAQVKALVVARVSAAGGAV